VTDFETGALHLLCGMLLQTAPLGGSPSQFASYGAHDQEQNDVAQGKYHLVTSGVLELAGSTR
jgi:hypothetical protein